MELLNMEMNPSCLSALDELLDAVFVAGRPCSNDYYVRVDLVRVFNVMAREVYGCSNDFPVVEAFGSFLMDMFSNESDLDLSVNFSSESVELPHNEKIKALERFSNKFFSLQCKGHVYGVNPILAAKVPILKVVDGGTGIECDISIDNKDGIVKSQFVFIVSAIDERFQKLSSLMKAWAKAHGINSAKHHTLSSLAILLLVALHLQTREPPILPPFSVLLKDGTNLENLKKIVQEYLQYGKENKESVGELFATLLSKLASVKAKWSEGLCASTYEGSWISKTWEFSRNGLISVEDFIDRSQNVAGAVREKHATVIYQVINSSLCHLSEFIQGRIQATELKELLFGSPSRKRRFTVLDAELSPPVSEEKNDTELSSIQVRVKKARQIKENDDTELSPSQVEVKKGRRARKRENHVTKKLTWVKKKIDSLELEKSRQKLQLVGEIPDQYQSPVIEPSVVPSPCDDGEWASLDNQIQSPSFVSENKNDTELPSRQVRVKKGRHARRRERKERTKLKWMRDKIESLESEEPRDKLQWVREIIGKCQSPVIEPSPSPCDDGEWASLENQIQPPIFVSDDTELPPSQVRVKKARQRSSQLRVKSARVARHIGINERKQLKWMREIIEDLESEKPRERLQWVKEIIDDYQSLVSVSSVVPSPSPYDNGKWASLDNQS